MPVTFKGHLNADESIAALHRAAARFKPDAEPAVIPCEHKVQRICYIPVEIAMREMASKSWVAGELARLGWEVIIGASWSLGAQGYGDIPPGVVLFKTMNFFDGIGMHHAKKHGHLTACLNEELFGIKPEPSIYEYESHPLARSLTDLACAHGQTQADVYAGVLPNRTVITVTGNPRATFGEVQHNPEANEILVCLMAGNCNGILPVEEYMGVTFRAFNRADPRTLSILEEAIVRECEHHAAILNRANELEAQGHTVRLRPHPVENPSLYEVQGNIILDDRTSIRERLKDAARVVFISSCGTGVDACLAGVPTERIGTGGHGMSSLEPADIRANYATECTLAPAIDAFQRDRSRPGRMSATRALGFRQPWSPGGFHRAKFRDYTAEEVSQLAGGATVAQVGWNLFAVTA